MKMLNTLIQAINNRLEINFTYSGIARTGQPSAVGSSLKGNDVLRVYQTKGGHLHPDHKWDLCCVSKLSNVSLTKTVFHKDPPDYKRGDQGMSSIYAQL